MATPTDLIQQLYVAYYNRPADVAGLAFWTNALSNGATIDQISASFNSANEYTAAYAGKSPANIVDTVYLNLFGRHAEAGGLDFWAPKVASGAITVAALVKQILAGAVNADGTPNADALVYANKVSAAEAFTTEIGTPGNEAERLAYEQGGSAVLAAAKAFIAGVTDTTSLTAATTNIHTIAQGVVSPVVAGQVYALTTTAEALTGTSGNDTFNAFVDTVTAANSTISAADQIDGAGGNDVLNVVVTGTTVGATMPVTSIKNIETVNVRSVQTAGGTFAIDNALLTGVTAINVDRSTSAVTVNNATTVGIIGDGTVANAAVTAAYGASAAAATINVSNGVTGGALTVTGAGLSKLTINSTGAANVLGGVTAAGTTTAVVINADTNLTTGNITGVAANAAITVTGAAAKVNVGTLTANVKTVDASAFKGGVTATLNTGITSFKGGAGNDVVTAAATTATGAVIDGGTGTNKLVVDTTTGNNDLATNGAAYKNFSQLKNIGGTATSLDVSLVAGVTSLETGAAGGGFSKMTAAQAANVLVSANLGGTATTYSLATATGTTDVLGLNFTNSTATTVENATGLAVDGFETLNLTAGSGLASVKVKADGTAAASTDYDNFGFSTAANLTKITLAGAFGAQIDASANAVKVTTIDASANTAGAAILTGGQTGALTVTGTAAADIITLGTMGSGGVQSISAGAGNDSISGSQANINAAAKIDGGAGVDTLTITDTGALTVNDQTFKNVTGVEKLAFGTTTGALGFVVGGYANGNLAGANGGVLDVSVTKLTTGGVSVDASGLGGSNSLKLAVSSAAAGGTLAGNVSVIGSAGGKDAITIVTDATTSGTITINESANTVGTTIDASGIVAAGATAITGGKGADTILTGAAAATITGGKGADVITLATGHATQTLNFAAGDSSLGANDVVNGYNLTTDVIHGTSVSTALITTADIGNGFTIAAGIATKAGATVADFLAAATALTQGNGVGSAPGVVGFSDGANTWVVFSDGNAATTNDVVVELVGVTATGFAAAAAAGKIVLA